MNRSTTLPGFPAGQQGPTNPATSLLGFWTQNAVLLTIVALVVGALLATVVITWARRRGEETGARLFYLVAIMCTAISANTSWRFFRDILHISDIVERVAMFGVIEAALIACAYAMRANVRQGPQPGPARTVAWALAGLAGYMALVESGPLEGLARVALGPVLGIIALHLALGIELRQRHGERTGTWGRVLAEFRERALSWLGLANEQRDALERIRDRNARRAARLALASKGIRRHRRLQKALRKSNVAHDPVARQRLLDELAVLRHADTLADLDQPSPWLTDTESSSSTAGNFDEDPTIAPNSAGDHSGYDTERRQPLNHPSSAEAGRSAADTADVETTMSMPLTNGRPQPALAIGSQPATDDEGANNDVIFAGEAGQTSDERVQQLVRLLQAGHHLSGPEVGDMFNVSPRTGQRLINRADKVLQARQRHLETLDVMTD